jgi:starch synthase
MRVLFVSSEVYPLAKTGGLADVSHSLPLALRSLGVDVRLLIPAYPQALERAERRGPALPLARVMGFDEVALIPARLPGSELPLWLVDCPALFARDGGLYCDREGNDWPDNHLRFALLAHVGARLAAEQCSHDWRPDVVHANDWHCGLLPLLSRECPESAAPTLFAIHNMAFQGTFPMEVAGRLGLDPRHFATDGIEYYGKLSYLKAGIRYADRLVTVSPTYARQITSPEFGFGLEGLLAARAGDLEGILNGIDYGIWDPRHDPLIPACYSTADLSGKRACKAALQAELGLEIDPEVPLFAFASRLTEQKMADQVLALAPALAERFGQLAFVAEGERRLERGFAELAQRWPGHIAGTIGYDETAAHRLLAGADILLAPARFEPCGLIQLYAMRYSTIPIVHPTGGLADTVVDVGAGSLAARRATGFHASGTDAEALMQAIERAETLRRAPLTWRRLCETAMAQDFSWGRSAGRYLNRYLSMVGAAEPGADVGSGEEGMAREAALGS